MKLYKSIFGAYYWSKAVDFASQRKYKQGLKALYKSEKYVELLVPERLIKAYLLYMDDKHKYAINEFKLCWNLINISDQINDDERIYLKYYICNFFEDNAQLIDEEQSFLEPVKRADINLQNVSKSIQGWYPI